LQASGLAGLFGKGFSKPLQNILKAFTRLVPSRAGDGISRTFCAAFLLQILVYKPLTITRNLLRLGGNALPFSRVGVVLCSRTAPSVCLFSQAIGSENLKALGALAAFQHDLQHSLIWHIYLRSVRPWWAIALALAARAWHCVLDTLDAPNSGAESCFSAGRFQSFFMLASARQA